MWLRKRVLKKEHNKFAKKRLLAVSLVCGGLGILLVLIGFFIQNGEPLFASPVPSLKDDPTIKIVNVSDEAKEFLKEKQINFSSLSEAKGKSYIITLKDGGEVIITDEKDVDEQLASLQRIVSQLTMEGKKLKRLDLRFDRPILVLQ